MSSIPVQFLIYVASEPNCAEKPIILPVQGCLEVAVSVLFSFNVTILNRCDWTNTSIAELVTSKTVLELQPGNLIVSVNDPSIVYMAWTWIPSLIQVGTQEICFVAYTKCLS